MNALGIGITNPFMWAGLLALGIPLAIHLMTRRTPLLIVFPTLRFLNAAQARQSRIYRIRHWLLLALRTVILALLLAAFLRPILQAGSLAAAEDAGAGTAAILIVDASASMAYAGSGITPFARAQIAAEKLLKDLGASDMANVILADAVPAAVFPSPQTSRYPLISAIEKASATAQRADMDAALAMALRQLDQVSGYRKEVHLISDMQRSNWAAVNFAAIPEDVTAVFVHVGEDAASNAAITEVAVSPPTPALSETVRIICKVANYGREARELPVHLDLEGMPPQEDRLRVPPGMTATATFVMRPRATGVFEGRVHIPGDALHFDDTRYFTLHVSERINVAILSAPAAPAMPPARLLEVALNPFEAQRGVFVPAVMRPDAFDTFAAARSQAVLLVAPGPLAPSTAAALAQYVRQGGGLLYFLTQPQDKVNLGLLAEAAGEGFNLPVSLGALEAPERGRAVEVAQFREANYDAPALRKFRDTAALGSVQFHRYFTTERQQGQGQVLLRYDNGHVALAEQSLGLGVMLLANFSPGLDDSDLARQPVFVPLLHELVYATRPRGGGVRSFAPGLAASTTVRLEGAEPRLRHTAPSGDEINAVIEVSGQEAAVIFSRTEEVGLYRIYDGDARVGAVAVNVDSRESNLETLSLEQMQELAALSSNQMFAQAGGTLRDLQRLREGRPLWHYLLLAGMCFMVLEQALALWWRK